MEHKSQQVISSPVVSKNHSESFNKATLFSFSINSTSNQGATRGFRFGNSNDNSGPSRQTMSRHNSTESTTSMTSVASRYSRRESVNQNRRELGPVRESMLHISMLLFVF
jgi:hypothetical protein